MIAEDDLRRLLAEAADTIPPPGRPPEDLLVDVAQQSAPRPRRRPPGRVMVAGVAAALLAVVAVGAVLAGDGADSSSTVSETAADLPTGGGEEAAVDADASPEADGALDLAAPADSSSGAQESQLAETAESPTAAAQPAPVDGAKIIRTGSLDLEVREGAFDSTVARIVAQTTGLGGYVADSTTSESGDAPSGSITVRVPGDSFETLLADLRELGDVKAVSSKGTDVTAQYTDLQARLTALVATRDRLATVLSEADNVPDILAVQDRITAVQVEIETVQGQQKLLDDQTTFATLAITVGEPGAEIVEIEPDPEDGLGQAWDDARRRFGDSVEAIVSWSGSAAVVLLIGLILLGLSRIAWIGVRRRLV